MAILLICALLIPPTFGCFGGGGGACCPPSTSCAPSVPPCQPASYAQPAPQPVAVAPQPCASGGCGAGGSYAAPAASGYAASYAAPASVGYAAPSSDGYAAQPVANSYAASYPRPLSGSYQAYSQSAGGVGYSTGNVAPVVRKVITVQKTLPESKLDVQDVERTQTVDVVEPQSQPADSVVDEEQYITAATPQVVQVQPDAASPSPVPIVVLPIPSSSVAPVVPEVTAAIEPAPAPAPVPAPAPAPAPAEPSASSEYQASIDNAYEEIASEEEALKKQEKQAEYGKEKGAEAVTGSPTIPPAVRETYGFPDLPGAEGSEPQPQAPVYEKTAVEASAATKEPEPRPVTLIESYQGYYQEPTVASIPAAPEQQLTGIEPEQRVDLPSSSSQSGEYIEDTSVPEEPNTEPDGGACNNEDLRAIVESALRGQTDNLEAARQIEGDASKKFGGRFNAIVSDAEFAYVNWYGKMNCQLRVGNRHSLTWED